MKMTPAKLRQDLQKGNLAPVYLFHGEEEYLARQAYDQTLKKLLADGDPGFNLEVFSAADSSPGQVHGALAQFPLMGGPRVVAVRHLEEVNAEWLAGLVGTVESPPPDSHLILTAARKMDARTKFFKAVSKAGVVLECGTPGERELLDRLEEEAKELGCSMDLEARMLLLARTGEGLADLLGEVAKLALFVHPAEKIRARDVAQASAAWRGYTNFDLGDAVGERDGLKALSILHHLLEAGEAGKTGPALVGVLAHRLRTWCQARDLLDQGLSRGAAAKAMKGWERYNLQYVIQAEKFDRADLGRAVERLHRVDLALKTGAPARERLEGFILWLCRGD